MLGLTSLTGEFAEGEGCALHAFHGPSFRDPIADDVLASLGGRGDERMDQGRGGDFRFGGYLPAFPHV